MTIFQVGVRQLVPPHFSFTCPGGDPLGQVTRIFLRAGCPCCHLFFIHSPPDVWWKGIAPTFQCQSQDQDRSPHKTGFIHAETSLWVRDGSWKGIQSKRPMWWQLNINMTSR